jgi:hypothetical protein
VQSSHFCIFFEIKLSLIVSIMLTPHRIVREKFTLLYNF